MSEQRKIGSFIKSLREARGLTQEEAARLCKMEYKYYQRYESNTPRDMRLSTLEKIAKGFGIAASALIDGDR